MAQKTFAQLFYLTDASIGQRIARDARLIKFLFRMFWRWATLGRKVRARYRRCLETGETFWLDDLDPARRPK